MRSICLFVLVVCLASEAQAVEKSMLNLKLPSALEAGQAQFFLQHRFYGPIDEKPFETFFGTSGGANVGLGLRVCPLKNAELIVTHATFEQEYRFGGGYSFSLGSPGIRGEADVEMFSFKAFRFENGRLRDNRRTGWFGRLDIKGPSIAAATPVLNAGYDSDNRKAGFGFGLDCAFSKAFSLIGEYFPRVDRKGWEGSRSYDCFAAGLKIQTYGHHFLFQVGNSTDIGFRRMMRGAPTKNLMIGFGIQRLFE
jgi:hypothetical protein